MSSVVDRGKKLSGRIRPCQSPVPETGIDSGYFSKPARKLSCANRSIDHFILDPGKLNGFHLSNASWVEVQREARERTQIFAPTE